MCGRYGLTREKRELAGEFEDLNVKVNVPDQDRYNVAPTQGIVVLRRDHGDVAAQLLRWGIDLPWARAGERSREMINVKAETAIKGGPFGKLLDARRSPLPGHRSWAVQHLGPIFVLPIRLG